MNITERMMSFMADFFVQFGANPTLGRLLGLLMSYDEAVSLEELAQVSGLSKASVSIHMRTLEQFEYCRKRPPGSDRRSFYELEDDFVATSYRRRLNAQLRMLDRLEALATEIHAPSDESAAERRLEELASFQRMAAESSARLLEEWEERRKK